jgi:hypothetical protein
VWGGEDGRVDHLHIGGSSSIRKLPDSLCYSEKSVPWYICYI